MTSERLARITAVALWWPLMLVDKMRPGPLRFVCNILVLPLCIPCGLTALPLGFATFILEIWEKSQR